MRKPSPGHKPPAAINDNVGFAGPFESGHEALDTIFPGISRVPVAIETPPWPADGGVSLDELAIIAAISRWLHPSKVLEIGTFQGWTTHNIALQLEKDAEVVTIDLPVGVKPILVTDGWNERYFPVENRDHAFAGHDTTNRIRCIEADTAKLSPTDLPGPFDLVFIDGSHAFEYVENDSRLALSVAASPSVILWHDYGKDHHWPGVTEYLHGCSRRRELWPLYWLNKRGSGLQTSLVLYLHGLTA